MHEIERIERFQVPTVDQLADIEGLTPADAEQIVAVLKRHNEGEITHEEALKACDEIIGTCGVVSLESEDYGQYTDEGIRMCPPFSYCNAGDPYVTTLARNHKAGAWVVACWADLAEEYERENELGDFETFSECPETCPSCGHKAFELQFFPGSSRGPSFSWVCTSCNHHAFADTVDDEHGGVSIGEDDDFNTVTVRAVENKGSAFPWTFRVYVDDVQWKPRPVGTYRPEEWLTAQQAREAWLLRQPEPEAPKVDF